MTYESLQPIFFQMEDPDNDRKWKALMDCIPPIECHGKFHIEKIAAPGVPAVSTPGCSGNLTVFSMPQMSGENLTITDSIQQVYHDDQKTLLRSLKSEGKCCWLLFEYRYFSGTVERICGDVEQLLRKKNIGSMKRIEPEVKQ